MRAPIVQRHSVTKLLNCIAACTLFLLCISATSLSQSRKPNEKASTAPAKLSNAVVVQLTKLRQPACVIIATIQTNETAFDTSGAAISGLKSQGVDSAVLREMFESQMRGGKPLEHTTPCGDQGSPRFATGTPTPTPIGGFTNTGGNQNPQLPGGTNQGSQPGQPVGTEQGGVPKAPAPPNEISRPTMLALGDAMRVSLDFNRMPHRKFNPGCPATGAVCITLDWATKTTDKDNVLRKTGDYQLHVVNVNDIFYQYSIQGQTNTIASGNDLQLLKDDATGVVGFLGDQSKNVDATKTAAQETAKKFGLAPQPCPLDDLIQSASNKMQSLQTALEDYGAKTDKGVPSIPLQDAMDQWEEVIRHFDDFRGSVVQLQTTIRNMPGPGGCTDQEFSAAASLIKDKVEPLVQKFKTVDHRVWGPHVVDSSPLFCERTAGCSFSVKETLKGDSSALAAGSPFIIDFKPFYAQLSVDGGFLLTTIPALSYSSRTAPDPSDPTNKTQNVLAVEGASRLRPAMVALLTYHFPWHFLDGINQGLGFSAGPVFDISNGKADTSKFGLFAGGTAHIWNRFFLSAGVHVGEFADFPQGFTKPGQVIPTGTGTPTPVKRYTTRFAFGITYKMKDLSVSSDAAQATTKAADSGSSNNSNNSGNAKK